MLISATDIIKKSWQFYQAHWRALLVYVALLFLPMAAFFIGFVIISMGGYLVATYTSHLAGVVVSVALTVVLYFTAALFAFWNSLAMMRTVGLLLNNTAPGEWRTAFATVRPVLWPAIYTSLLVGLIVAGGTLLFIIPGIIFAVWYIFTTQTVIFEEKKGVEALRASKRLVIGRWWGILWRVLAPSVVFTILAAIPQQIITYLFSFLEPTTTAKLLQSLAVGLISAPFVPLFAAALLILYFNAQKNAGS